MEHLRDIDRMLCRRIEDAFEALHGAHLKIVDAAEFAVSVESDAWYVTDKAGRPLARVRLATLADFKEDRCDNLLFRFDLLDPALETTATRTETQDAKILRLIEQAEFISASDADWELKYDRIFSLRVSALIREAGYSFDYHDPKLYQA